MFKRKTECANHNIESVCSRKVPYNVECIPEFRSQNQEIFVVSKKSSKGDTGHLKLIVTFHPDSKWSFKAMPLTHG
jgi:hypothetical protein